MKIIMMTISAYGAFSVFILNGKSTLTFSLTMQVKLKTSKFRSVVLSAIFTSKMRSSASSFLDNILQSPNPVGFEQEIKSDSLLSGFLLG